MSEMYIKRLFMELLTLLLLLPLMGQCQLAEEVCYKPCYDYPGTSYKECRGASGGDGTKGGKHHDVIQMECDKEEEFSGDKKWYKLPAGSTDIVITAVSVSDKVRLVIGSLICSFKQECFTITLTSGATAPIVLRLKTSIFKIQAFGLKFGIASLKFSAVCDKFYHEYRSYNEIMKRIDFLEDCYGKLMKKRNIGKSYGDRDLVIIELTNKETSSIDTKKTIWVDGGAHAREWISISTAMYLAEQILKNPKVMDKTDFHVMPLMNPDGYEYSRTTDRNWRKNRAEIADSECVGVDLNRNWDHEFGKIGASNDPCDETYRGPKAFSERETELTSNYLKTNLKDLDVYISLHSYGKLWLAPWGYTKAEVENKNDRIRMAKMGKAAVAAIKKVNNKMIYKSGPGGKLLNYLASGVSDDWSYDRVKGKGKYAYTVELPPGLDDKKWEFELPKGHIIPTGNEIWAALKCVNVKVHDLTKRC